MNITEITNENVNDFIANNESVLIDFHATWCGPCRAMSPIIDKFAEEHPEIAVGKCEVEDNEEAAGMFGVRNLPFIVFIKNGELIDSKVGLQNEKALNEMVCQKKENRYQRKQESKSGRNTARNAPIAVVTSNTKTCR